LRGVNSSEFIQRAHPLRSTSMQALVSCLCVTHERPAFREWLLWNFDKQSWPHKELIVVDSSATLAWPERPDLRVIACDRNSVPLKRNIALDAVSGRYLAWFDDDDWQHPERLERAVEALERSGGW